MKAKEYLQQIRTDENALKKISDQIVRIDTEVKSAGAINYDKLNVQTSPMNKQENLIIKLQELKDLWIDKKLESETRRSTIIVQILELENKLYSDILYFRYVDGFSLVKCADKAHISHDWVRHVHGYALRDFADKYLND